ncbi:MAG: hypothetical protein HOK71_15240 [Planctomycetaceae bacterium]|jgi:hypothetical protein|nr:hypothetical protein [Planctomycetaceae bacterium]MBT6486000.1 hypothetical protein [Planctomycetaceae bacterium]
MGTLAGILGTAALSHLGGAALGGVLARFGLFGFGGKLRIARHALRVGRALRAAVDHEPTTQARAELARWLQQHDPHNESRLGDSLEFDSAMSADLDQK